MIGRTIGSYEVLAPLGSGGMGEVYRARDAKLGRDVAIKVLPSAVAADAERLSRFEREARLLASLNHPNIGAIYGFEDSGGHPALILELVEGDTLADRLRQGPIPVHEALTLARQIADALDAAHERGIIHRDLKPANIKVTPDGVVKVLDFGLAKALAPDPESAAARDLASSPTVTVGGTKDGVILGTAAYMSPEQARGKTLDRRTDIWAFGCVLFEMLTGRRAFAGETTSDVIAAILERTPEWSALPAGTPASVHRVLRRSLDKSPRRRMRDIADVRTEIEDAISGAGAPQGASPDRARGRLLGFAVGVVVTALAAVVLIQVPWRESSADSAPEFSRVVRLTSGPSFESAPALSPDGKWVAYLSNARGPTDVWVKFLAGGDAINLTASTQLEVQTQTDIGGLAISPDGTTIAFDATSPGGSPAVFETWVIPAPLGGVARKPVQGARAMRWSPDGANIAFLRPGSMAGDAVWVADADGGNAREVAGRQGGMHKHWPAWSADGRFVYFIYSMTTTNSEPSEIYRVPFAGGPIEVVVASARRAVFPVLPLDGQGLIYSANPSGADLSLWWSPSSGGVARRLTTGVGEYGQPAISADGRRLVCAVGELHQSLVALVAGGGAVSQPRAITDGSTGDLDPTVSAERDLLVFSSTRLGNRNLWIARADGREARPLTSGAAIDERPALSQDGLQIAFLSDRGGVRGLWVMNAEGGAARLVTKAQVLDTISWSADGQEIVYATPGDEPSLWVATVSDGSIRRLVTPGPAVTPAWSPRGDVIAYVEVRPATRDAASSQRVAFVTPGGEARHAMIPMATANGALAWDSGGRRLAALGNPGTMASTVSVLEPGSSAPPRELYRFPVDVRLRGIAWSRDGSSLIVGQQGRTSDIVLLEASRP